MTPGTGEEKAAVEELIVALDIDQTAYRLGNTQVRSMHLFLAAEGCDERVKLELYDALCLLIFGIIYR